MANHPSAEKRNRQRVKRTLRNRTVASSVRTLVKRVRTAIAANDKVQALAALKRAVSSLDRAARKNVIHRKAASRTLARLSAQIHHMGA